MKHALLAASLLVLLFAGSALGGFVWASRAVQTPLDPGSTVDKTFDVPRGVSARALGPMLAQRGLVKQPLLWRFLLWQRGGLQAKAGRHQLGPGMSMAQIADALEQNPLAEDAPFTMVEGWRLADTDAALAQRGWIKPGAYLAEASHPERFNAPFPIEGPTLEGYLYPETYRVLPGSLDVHELLQRQLDQFAERFWQPDGAMLGKSGHTLREIVIMASMLEREEPDPAQRSLVAGILWKRVDTGTPLGVDATSRYGLREWNDRQGFLSRLHDAQDPWNSRLHKGLPPGPIGAPTLASLEAALHPLSSGYWYYLHDAEHHIHPSKNAAEHEALRKKYNVY